MSLIYARLHIRILMLTRTSGILRMNHRCEWCGPSPLVVGCYLEKPTSLRLLDWALLRRSGEDSMYNEQGARGKRPGPGPMARDYKMVMCRRSSLAGCFPGSVHTLSPAWLILLLCLNTQATGKYHGTAKRSFRDRSLGTDLSYSPSM